MAKTFYPAGVLDIMARLDLKILKSILHHSGLPEYMDAKDAYEAYLKNFAKNEWYECCSRLYDIDLASFYNQDDSMLIIDNLKSEDCLQRYLDSVALPGSASVSDMIAWISMNMDDYWNDLINEAYASQVESGGCKYYVGDVIEGFDGEINSKTRQMDFKRDFGEYMTKNRSKVVNVHVDMNPLRDMTRFVIYHDPFPRKGSEFNDDGTIAHPTTREVEHITVIYFHDEEYPYVTVKGKDMSPNHEPEIARMFINWILGRHMGDKPKFRYDMKRFNDDAFEFPEIDDDHYAGYRMSGAKIAITRSDRSVDVVSFESAKNDVKMMSDGYLHDRAISRSRCRYAEVRFKVGIYVANPAEYEQVEFDGSVSDVRLKLWRDVKITSGERTVLKCRDRLQRAMVENILDKWGVVNLDEAV